MHLDRVGTEVVRAGAPADPKLVEIIGTPGPDAAVSLHRHREVIAHRDGRGTAEQGVVGVLDRRGERGGRPGRTDPKLTIGVVTPAPDLAIEPERDAVVAAGLDVFDLGQRMLVARAEDLAGGGPVAARGPAGLGLAVVAPGPDFALAVDSQGVLSASGD